VIRPSYFLPVASTEISTCCFGLICLSWVFLEIGGDPEIVERNQGEEVLARGYVLVDFKILAGDDAVGGSDDLGVLQVESRLIDLGLGALHLGLGLLGAGVLDGYLLRTCLCGFKLRLRLRNLVVGCLDIMLGGIFAGQGIFNGGLIGIGLGPRRRRTAAC